MKFFLDLTSIRHRSIQLKLILFFVFILVVFAMVCVLFAFMDTTIMGKQFRMQQSALADTLGANIATSILFDDAHDASEVLSSIDLVPWIQSGLIFDNKNQLFASHSAIFDADTVSSLAEARRFSSNRSDLLMTEKPIIHQGKQIGTIALIATLQPLQSQTTAYLWTVLAITALVAFLSQLASRYLHSTIVQPIINLACSMERVSAGGELDCPVKKTNDDELGALCDGFNQMLVHLKDRNKRLQSLQDELITTARTAGRAEVATNVLHDVGNVLNSVNVSSGQIHDELIRSKVARVKKSAELLIEHQGQLPEFFRDDPRGKLFPVYLEKLSILLLKEHDRSLAQVNDLNQSIDHIKEIVRSQQSQAVNIKVVQPCDLSSLMDDAAKLTGIPFARYGIDVVQEYDEIPNVDVDKSVIIQALVNLIGNAKDAIESNNSGDRKIILRVKQENENVLLQVQDTGIGIAADKLTKVFVHGFTEKTDGYGFGLHSAANSVSSMGGHLSVVSDGVGKGALFTIELSECLPSLTAIA